MIRLWWGDEDGVPGCCWRPQKQKKTDQRAVTLSTLWGHSRKSSHLRKGPRYKPNLLAPGPLEQWEINVCCLKKTLHFLKARGTLGAQYREQQVLSGCPLPVKLGGVRSHSHLERVSRETEEEGYMQSMCMCRKHSVFVAVGESLWALGVFMPLVLTTSWSPLQTTGQEDPSHSRWVTMATEI